MTFLELFSQRDVKCLRSLYVLNTPQIINYTATYLSSRKLPKLDELDMQDTAGEAGTSSCDVLLWTPTYNRANAGRPARTYIQQLREDTGCSPKVCPEAMNDREKWWERVRDIRASGTTWWWWWWWWFTFSYKRFLSCCFFCYFFFFALGFIDYEGFFFISSSNNSARLDFLYSLLHSLSLTLSLSFSLSLILFLPIRPYHLSLSAGLPNYICLHRADINKFLIVGKHWHIHI